MCLANIEVYMMQSILFYRCPDFFSFWGSYSKLPQEAKRRASLQPTCHVHTMLSNQPFSRTLLNLINAVVSIINFMETSTVFTRVYISTIFIWSITFPSPFVASFLGVLEQQHWTRRRSTSSEHNHRLHKVLHQSAPSANASRCTEQTFSVVIDNVYA